MFKWIMSLFGYYPQAPDLHLTPVERLYKRAMEDGQTGRFSFTGTQNADGGVSFQVVPITPETMPSIAAAAQPAQQNHNGHQNHQHHNGGGFNGNQKKKGRGSMAFSGDTRPAN